MGEIYENIDEYLNGTLQGQELIDFESKLATDKEFSEEVRQRYILIQAIKEARKAELKQYIKDRVSPAELNKTPMQVKRNFNFFYAAAAASVIIAAAVIYLLTRPPVNELTSQNPPVQQPADSLHGNDTMPAVIHQQDFIAQEKAVKKMPGSIRQQSPGSRTPDSLVARADDADGVPDMMDMKEGKVANQFEDAVVKRDELIRDTTLLARVVNVISYYNDSAAPKSAEQNRKDEESVKESVKKKKVYPRSYDRNANTSMDQSERYVYTLEYWKSPINFQGYAVNGKVIRVYGIDSAVRVQLLSYQDKLYLAWGNEYYKLETDGKYHEYVKESDAAVLNVLRKN